MPDGRGSEESTIFVAGLPSDMTNLEMPLDLIGSMGKSMVFFSEKPPFFIPKCSIYGNDNAI